MDIIFSFTKFVKIKCSSFAYPVAILLAWRKSAKLQSRGKGGNKKEQAQRPALAPARAAGRSADQSINSCSWRRY